MSRTKGIRAALAAAIATGVLAPVARANILAAIDVPAGGTRTDMDIALYDATTGTRLSLPVGVNTTDDELHPSVTPDGRLLTFERSNPLSGTVRIALVDLATNQAADLFSGLETSVVPPTSPAIAPDGKTVITGRPAPPGDTFGQTLTLTDVSSFPATTTGPFPHRDLVVQQAGGSGGQTLEPAAGANGLFAYEPRAPGILPGITVGQFGGSSHCNHRGTTLEFSQPALPAASQDYFLMTERALPGGPTHPGDIWVGGLPVPANVCGAVKPAPVPSIVNTSDDESRPSLTPDARYVGFVRHSSSDLHSRLFEWDTLTQQLVNNSGIDLGVLSPREVDLIALRGNLSTWLAPVLRLTNVSLSGLVSGQLLTSAGVGILVQRVVGHKRLLGRRVPRMRLVGRVPLGQFKRGRLRIHWNRRVNGHKLPPGLYQVTVRALAPSDRVEDLGRPVLIRIRPQ